MTLVEVMIAMAIGSVVLAAIMALTFFSARSFAALSNYVDMDMKSRNALDKMSREIRQANTLLSFSPTQLVFSGTENSNGYTLTYIWDSNNPTNKTLTRTKNPGGETEVLLSGCTNLAWSMYQRNMTTDGSYEPIPTTNVNECKLLRLTWVCSRQILGKTANTESVQSSEVVIRKK